ncbi:MAG TPA: hypothetical protein VD794_15995 [Flavisolibacter sp.]|nr:hypothetical protein [Flavisolibacter sp.]
MLLEEAQKLIRQQITDQAKHQDYARVTELANLYRILITGKDIKDLLIKIVQREDDAAFEQRVRLTKSITPAVAASLRTPFSKVTRNDRIIKAIKIGNSEDSAAVKNVQKMIDGYYGASRKKNKGLDYWMKTRFVEMNFIDPNAWTVEEWQQPESQSEVVKVRPFEVSAYEAWNFSIVNDETKWLFVCQEIMMFTEKKDRLVNYTKALGKRYTLYDADYTIVFEQVNLKYRSAVGAILNPNEELTQLDKVDYLVKTFEPKIGYAPCFRIGYKRDEATAGRTFVNPWHDALCYFEKSLKTVSELDLTMTMHAFPQKIQFTFPCDYIDQKNQNRRCQNGMLTGGLHQCPKCKGTGVKPTPTSAQDFISIKMEAGQTPKDLPDLNNMLVFKAPPTETLEFQNKYVLQLEKQAHQAVFNSQVFVRTQGPTVAGERVTDQTATENLNNMESVYDALDPFTEKYSELWREKTTTFAIIAGAKVDQIDITYDFPEDYKLKTFDYLLSDRKAATESGAPSYVIESIDDDLASIQFKSNPVEYQKYKVKKRFHPFPGKSFDEILLLLASEYVPEYSKVLYSNFDMIFKELVDETPNFYVILNSTEQKNLLDKKVDEYMQRIKPPQPVITPIRTNLEAV